MKSSGAVRFWRLTAVAWAALSLIGAAWSFATPIGGAPDEPSHLIKAAAVVRGEFGGTPAAGGLRVRVPEYIANSKPESCYAFQSNTTPNCAAADPIPGGRIVSAVTSAGLYNPAYYAIVGWPSLIFHTEEGIYAMRIVSDIVVSLFLAFAFGFVALWRRPTLPLIGLATALTPMVFFLGGSVNPNSLEISATLAAFVGVLTTLREPARELLATRMTIVSVAAGIAANMRGLSLLWLAVAILAPFLLVRRSQISELLRVRSVRLAILGTAIAFTGAAVWLLTSNSLGYGQSATGAASPPGVGTSHLAGFAWTLLSTFYYGQQVVGIFGWLDTPAPAFVYFVWSFLVGGLLVLAFTLLRRRALLFVAVLVTSLVLLPPILQGAYITSGGLLWQGRYILPVFACVMVGIAACLSDVVPLSAPIRRRLLMLVLGTWAVAQLLSFATTLKRYVVGATPGWPSVLHPVWSPPGGVIPTLLVFAVLITATAVAVAWWASRTTEPDLDQAVPVKSR